jgi:hypothetical protein
MKKHDHENRWIATFEVANVLGNLLGLSAQHSERQSVHALYWHKFCAIHLLTQLCLANNRINVVPHPPYSPHFLLWDIFLFQKLKISLKGRRLHDITMIQWNLWDVLDKCPTKHPIKCSEWSCNRWAHCMLSQEDYIEQDNTDKSGVAVMEK